MPQQKRQKALDRHLYPPFYGGGGRNGDDYQKVTAVKDSQDCSISAPPAGAVPIVAENVRRMLCFRFLNGFAFVTRAGYLFDQYIHLRFNSNAHVGWFAMASGLSTFFMALPSGLLLDSKYILGHRARLLNVCALLCICCILLNYYALWHGSVLVWVLCSVAWRGWYELTFVTSEALFTDSIVRGQRSRFFVWRRIVTTVSGAGGPLLHIVLFTWWGDEWNEDLLRSIMAAGLCLSFPQVLALWGWNEVGPGSPVRAREDTTDIAASLEEDTKPNDDKHDDATIAPSPPSPPYPPPPRRFLFLRESHIPWLIHLCHLVTFAGAGMSVKYFQLFFRQEYQMKPISLLWLNLSYTISISAATYGAQKVGNAIGRAQASLLFTSLGTLSLFFLSMVRPLWLAMTIHVLRGALQNASTPIDRSVISDYTRSLDRGKWTGLQRISSSAWSVSALAGGYLSDRLSYRHTFRTTACIYLVSNILYLPLLCLVESDETKLSALKKTEIEVSQKEN